MPTWGKQSRRARMTWTRSRSEKSVRGWNSPAAGRMRGSETVTDDFQQVAEEMIDVSGEREGLLLPIGEAEEGADAEAAEAGGVGALGAIEAPVEIALGAGGVKLGVKRTVVGFLVNDEAFGAGPDDGFVLGRFHGADFERDGGDEVFQALDAAGEVVGRDELGVLAGDEEDVAKALLVKMAGLGLDLVERQGDAENRIVAREAAILADVNALVGKIERREEAHGASEILAGELFGLPGHVFQSGAGLRIQIGGKAAQDAALQKRGIAEGCREGHGLHYSAAGVGDKVRRMAGLDCWCGAERLESLLRRRVRSPVGGHRPPLQLQEDSVPAERLRRPEVGGYRLVPR